MSTSAPDDFEALKIIVEALRPFQKEDQERILRWTREKFGLAVTQPIASISTFSDGVPHGHSQEQAGRPVDIKTFINSKNPQSDNQFAAAVAYYYQFEAPFAQRKAAILAADLQDATRLAGRNRLGDPAKTLRNALTQGYFDQAGRGSYTLSTVGENLVAMALPQAEGKVRVVKQKRTASKRKAKKK